MSVHTQSTLEFRDAADCKLDPSSVLLLEVAINLPADDADELDAVKNLLSDRHRICTHALALAKPDAAILQAFSSHHSFGGCLSSGEVM